MNYETAALLSEGLHYTIALSISGLILFRNYKNFVNLVIKFYLMFFIWGILCYILQGCPITLFENWVSNSIYGKPFYPNYTFSDSDFNYIITNTDFYIPAILILIVAMVNKYKR